MFLVYEGDCDTLGLGEEVCVVELDNFVVGCSEDEVIKVNAFCLSNRCWFRAFARALGKEVGADY
jgi:hypothetical protein